MHRRCRAFLPVLLLLHRGNGVRGHRCARRSQRRRWRGRRRGRRRRAKHIIDVIHVVFSDVINFNIISDVIPCVVIISVNTDIWLPVFHIEYSSSSFFFSFFFSSQLHNNTSAQRGGECDHGADRQR
jgi:hypothetical protein